MEEKLRVEALKEYLLKVLETVTEDLNVLKFSTNLEPITKFAPFSISLTSLSI